MLLNFSARHFWIFYTFGKCAFYEYESHFVSHLGMKTIVDLLAAAQRHFESAEDQKLFGFTYSRSHFHYGYLSAENASNDPIRGVTL